MCRDGVRRFLLLGTFLVLGAGCSSEPTAPSWESLPNGVLDLLVTAVTDSTITLTWSAPVPTHEWRLATYDLRWSDSWIDEGSWAGAHRIETPLPPPRTPGAAEEVTIRHARARPIYLALKSAASGGMWSPISNLASSDDVHWWTADPKSWGSARVTAVAARDGWLYAGGWFQSHDGLTANFLSHDGRQWTTLGDGPGGEAAFLIAEDRGVLAAGEFGVKQWRGGGWFGHAVPLDAGCSSLGVSGFVRVGGSFYLTLNMVGGQYCPHPPEAYLLRLDGDQLRSVLKSSQILTAAGQYQDELVFARVTYPSRAASVFRWSDDAEVLISDGLDGPVRALVEWNGDLIAGGEFVLADGKSLNHVARWDGSAWHALGEGLDGSVIALCVYNGDLVAGGEFHHAGSLRAEFVARWDGDAWRPLGTGMRTPPTSLATDGPSLYVAAVVARGGGANLAIARWAD